MWNWTGGGGGGVADTATCMPHACWPISTLTQTECVEKRTILTNTYFTYKYGINGWRTRTSNDRRRRALPCVLAGLAIRFDAYAREVRGKHARASARGRCRAPCKRFFFMSCVRAPRKGMWAFGWCGLVVKKPPWATKATQGRKNTKLY